MATEYKRKDALYEQAKEDGYRSRAAYKLIELQKRFRPFSNAARVLDLGAWPGGWLQVASEIVGPKGLVVGIDLTAIDPLDAENVSLVTGDFSLDETIEKLRELSSSKGYNCVLSDASPKLTGIPEADQYGTVQCAIAAFKVAEKVLQNGGSFVCKIFKGSETDKFVKSLKKHFAQLSRVELEATRSSSSETYVVGKGFKKSS